MTRFRWSALDALRTLSPEEAMELAARVAELTKAGLPLGDGLRALAGEVPGRRLPIVLRALAGRLDAGESLIQALESQGTALPVHLRGLILAGVRNGRLAEVLEDFVDLERGQLELRRRAGLSVAYPTLLLVFLAAVVVITKLYIIDPFERMFADFDAALPALTRLVLSGSSPLMWLFAGLLVLAVAAPIMAWLVPDARWIWPVLYHAPLLGPLLRFSQLTQFSRWMALLLEQEVTLPDALRLSAAGLRDANLARSCRRVADEVEHGRPLSESMAAWRSFPASMNAIIAWGQRTPALTEAFRAAAEVFEGRSRSHGRLLDSVLLPLVFLTIAVFVAVMVTALFMPLLSLIQKLT